MAQLRQFPDALRPFHVQDCYAALLREGLSARSVELAHVVLHASLRHAIKLGLITHNPADAAIPPRPTRRELRTLTADQAEKLFDAARETPNFRSLLVVLCTTGLRIGEALALKWSDIDFDSQSLSVKRALQRQRGRGLVFVEPKTALSRRTVHLTALACDELCRHRLRQAVDCDRAGTQWQDSDVVFASQLGSPLDPTNISHRFQRLIQAAGLPPTPLHGLRHTAATLLLQEGIHPRVVQEMLGHSTILQTLGTYSHVMPTMQQEAAKKMNSLFRPMDRELD